MKTIIQIILIILCSVSVYSQSGWIVQNSGTVDSLNSVRFVNSSTGWCVGNNSRILKTTNGGINWFTQGTSIVTKLNSIVFTTEQTGYIGGNSGVILKTTNSGVNWIRLSLPSNQDIASISFPNINVGYFGAANTDLLEPKIYKTTDAGSSFDSISSHQIDLLNSIQFINPTTGWICGLVNSISSPRVSKTTNGGVTWTSQSFMGPSIYLYSVFFIDSLNGLIANPNAPPFFGAPTVYRTTNGGSNWIAPLENTLGYMHSLFSINRNKAWAAGSGRTIYMTSNSGINWVRQESRISMSNYNSVYFTDSLTGWVVGDSGTILKTTTGGVLTNFSNTSTEIPDKYFLSQNYPNPFNPNTIINYQCSMFNFISLKIYDILGNEIESLVNENKPPGSYEVEWNASDFPSGVYLYKLEVNGNLIDTKRMILLR